MKKLFHKVLTKCIDEIIDNVQTQHLARKARNTKKNCSLEMTNLELDTFDWNLTFFLWDDALRRLFHYFFPDLFHVIYVLLFVWFLTHLCVDVVYVDNAQGCSISKVRALEEVAIKGGT